MLSDDDIQRVAIQCGMKSGQHWNKGRMNTSKMRSFARAIEREVRKQVLEDASSAVRELLDDEWIGTPEHDVLTEALHAIYALKEQP